MSQIRPVLRGTLHGKSGLGLVTFKSELDKDGHWTELEPLELAAETRDELEVVMPGTQSGLHRHEWIKHGSCYGDGSADRYYRDSLALMESLNTSGVKDLFEANIGQNLDTDTIRDAFDAEFGQGTGERVAVSCKQDGGRTLITELRLELHGTVTEQPDLGELLLAGTPTGSRCSGGVGDPAGFQ